MMSAIITSCPDLILVNGNVITMDADKPKAEAVAVAQGKIWAVGDSEAIRNMAGEGTMIIDLKGKVVLPGFIDCHTHFLQMGISLSYLDLRGTSSIEEVLEKLRERAKETEKGRWIVGCRWDESKWKERRYITRFDLDKVTPDNPVVLKRMDGHLWVVNTRGLETADVLYDEPGLEKDSSGEPSGLLRWGAKNYAGKCISPGREEMKEGLKLAVKESLRCGVTSVNELSGDMTVYREMEASGELSVRVYMGLAYSSLDALKKLGLSTGFGDEMLKLGPVKLFTDGSIGARTAALFEPYNDDPCTSGQLAITEDKLCNQIMEVHEAGSQVAVHAIGDRGIKVLLDAIKRVLEKCSRGDHRHRIEHAELLSDELMDYAQKLNVILSVQPNFVGEWGGPGELYEKRLGSRYIKMNPFRAILDRGIHAAFGSDCMPFGPMYGIWSAVNNPVQENRVSLHEAIYCYTLGAAYSSFEEKVKGSIEAGKLADLVVLSSNDMPERKDVTVEMTVVGGHVRYVGDTSFSLSG